MAEGDVQSPSAGYTTPSLLFFCEGAPGALALHSLPPPPREERHNFLQRDNLG